MHAVRYEAQSLYQILRVSSNAKREEIERAYRRIKAQLQDETTPPDPRLRVMIEQARDVLLDPVRREAYDREWFAPRAQVQRARRKPALMAMAVVALLALGAGGWMLMREPEASMPQARPRSEIEQAVAMAVGRVQRIDLSGGRSTLGVAFAISEGVLVTYCEGLTPTSEVIVLFGDRPAPVRVGAVDAATGLCKLTGTAVGSWPLELAHSGPKSGETVYLAAADPTGRTRLVDAQFKSNDRVGSLPAFRVSVDSTHEPGTPLIDGQARVVAAATRIEGHPAYVSVPRNWLPEVVVEHSAPAYRAPPQETAAPEALPTPNVSPERRERLQKAFRPPPQVPDDL
jgi:hypothetical protein